MSKEIERIGQPNHPITIEEGALEMSLRQIVLPLAEDDRTEFNRETNVMREENGLLYSTLSDLSDLRATVGNIFWNSNAFDVGALFYNRAIRMQAGKNRLPVPKVGERDVKRYFINLLTNWGETNLAEIECFKQDMDASLSLRPIKLFEELYARQDPSNWYIKKMGGTIGQTSNAKSGANAEKEKTLYKFLSAAKGQIGTMNVSSLTFGFWDTHGIFCETQSGDSLERMFNATSSNDKDLGQYQKA
ncbi:MAG: hypothetical protein CO136_03100 [Candidatus Levybacteria bacterium CG_4_9_14_3_um_filter_36_7]|nr:MAG: hypothetical protein CO136_03100 [Candidatus Levybacteria bacterium CG_4_9_14_3_um_filter_36_7]